MKTEKQIDLLELEKAQNIREETYFSDRIIMNNYSKMLNSRLCKDDEVITLVPPITSGVIEINTKISEMDEETILNLLPDETEQWSLSERHRFLKELIRKSPDISEEIYYSFHCEYKEETFIMSLDVLSSMLFEENFSWDGNIKVEIPYNLSPGDNEVCKVLSFSDATIEIYQRQKRKEKEIKEYMMSEDAIDILNALRDAVEDIITISSNLNYLAEHPEFKEMPEKEPREYTHRQSAKKKENVSEPREQKPREILLNGIKIKTTNNKVASVLRSKAPRKLTGCFGVRGHFRHYKTGKVVYIKPYTKGNDTQKQMQKRYIIKD